MNLFNYSFESLREKPSTEFDDDTTHLDITEELSSSLDNGVEDVIRQVTSDVELVEELETTLSVRNSVSQETYKLAMTTLNNVLTRYNIKSTSPSFEGFQDEGVYSVEGIGDFFKNVGRIITNLFTKLKDYLLGLITDTDKLRQKYKVEFKKLLNTLSDSNKETSTLDKGVSSYVGLLYFDDKKIASNESEVLKAIDTNISVLAVSDKFNDEIFRNVFNMWYRGDGLNPSTMTNEFKEIYDKISSVLAHGQFKKDVAAKVDLDYKFSEGLISPVCFDNTVFYLFKIGDTEEEFSEHRNFKAGKFMLPKNRTTTETIPVLSSKEAKNVCQTLINALEDSWGFSTQRRSTIKNINKMLSILNQNDNMFTVSQVREEIKKSLSYVNALTVMVKSPFAEIDLHFTRHLNTLHNYLSLSK